MVPTTLAELHNRIDECTVCGAFVRPFHKPSPGLDRGDGSDMFIVGQAPGRTEITSQKAFSGNSGTRLNEWLIACGRPANEPRNGVYLTSVLKCPINKPGDFVPMAHHCRHFLIGQLNIIRPRLVITLGKESFEYLRVEDGAYTDLIGKIYFPAKESFLSHHPYSAIVHWPHPSGLNRWHNEPGNAARLKTSFAEVKDLLEPQP